MIRSVALIAALLVLAGGVLTVVLACGPDYHHAHFSFQEPEARSLEDIHGRLFLSAAERAWTMEQVREAITAALVQAAARPLPATAAEALRTALVRSRHRLTFEQRWRLQDRLDLLRIQAGTQIDAVTVRAYLDAVEILDPAGALTWPEHPVDPAARTGAMSTLRTLAEGDGPLRAHARSWLAESALRRRDDALATVQGLLGPLDQDAAGPRAEAVAFQLARLPVQTWRAGRPTLECPGILEGLQRHLDAWPGGTWRADALGWQAFLLCRADDQIWPGHGDPLLTAVRIYQRLVEEEDLHGLFIPAVESLRLVYRRLHPEPPAAVLADPRHAAAFVHHALTDRRMTPPGGRARLRDDILRLAETRLLALGGDGVAPEVGLTLARAYLLIGRGATTARLARQALADGGGVAARHLAIRGLLVAGDLAEAWALWPELAERGDLEMVRDAAVRLGQAWEARGERARALECYLRGNSWLDAIILIDGEMRLDDLAAFVAAHPTLTMRGDGAFDTWSRAAVTGEGQGVLPAIGADAMPRVRRFLGKRLVRHGRVREALPFLAGEERAWAEELLALEAARGAATPQTEAAATYALAAFWYHRGRRLVFISSDWQQWALDERDAQDRWLPRGCWSDAEGRRLPLLDGDAAQFQARLDEIQAMTGIARALPLFLEVVERHPDSPEAPKALYSAACCWYWRDGPRLGRSPYWQWRAKCEGAIQRGHDLMLRLAREYPEHPLATSTWVRSLPALNR